MREIGFRGRRADGWWQYGDLMTKYVHHGGATIVVGGYVYSEVDPDTVGQYTGLKDRNGREIYEGDILQGYDKAGKPITRVVVEWSPEGYWGGRPLPGYHYRTCYGGYSKSEIIGIIHDNPELLGVE